MERHMEGPPAPVKRHRRPEWRSGAAEFPVQTARNVL
jgi:hypothetical protein